MGEDQARARAHVNRCPACARFFAQDRVLLDGLEALRRERAPLEVRERVFHALASARSRDRGRGPVRSRVRVRPGWWTAAAAGATLALVAGIAVTTTRAAGPRLEDPQGAIAEDYIRRAVGQDFLDTSDPREVTRFLQRELGSPLTPLRADGLVVERVEICLLDGTRGAMIRYRMEGRTISQYVVPRVGVRARPPAVVHQRVGSGPQAVPVVTWADPSLEQALVGPVDEVRLLELARGRERP